MKPTPEKEYSRRGGAAVAALIAVLVLVSFIPPATVGGIRLRRANILSDLLTFDDAAAPAAEPELFDEAEFEVDLEAVTEQLSAQRIEADTQPRRVETSFRWCAVPDSAERAAVERPAPSGRPITPIEEFTPDSSALARFCDTLVAARRPVRIAFLGDSFVEGDILTADLRERLQSSYGGGGAGFAPMASPLTGFRRTICTDAKGWTAYNIMQRKRAPEPLGGRFFVSGWVCQPAEGASTRWECTDARRHLDGAVSARVLFLSPRDSRIELVLNDTLRREFAVEGDEALRQAVVTAPRIGSLAFRVLSGHEGFVGYGASFEAPGIVVDNFSVRSNNGQALFWTNPAIDAQADALAGYDLVVLQYGLNIMQQGVHAYGNYAAQIEKMVAFVRECFPRAAVLILGVSDRSTRTDAGFEPMDAVPHMTGYQRRAARNTGAAFWSTADAMRKLGGMEAFVRNGWAGKDYTHINYAGGRRVAHALADALDSCVRRAFDRLEAARQREAVMLDSLRRAAIEAQLFAARFRPDESGFATDDSAEAESDSLPDFESGFGDLSDETDEATEETYDADPAADDPAAAAESDTDAPAEQPALEDEHLNTRAS